MNSRNVIWLRILKMEAVLACYKLSKNSAGRNEKPPIADFPPDIRNGCSGRVISLITCSVIVIVVPGVYSQKRVSFFSVIFH